MKIQHVDRTQSQRYDFGDEARTFGWGSNPLFGLCTHAKILKGSRRDPAEDWFTKWPKHRESSQSNGKAQGQLE